MSPNLVRGRFLPLQGESLYGLFSFPFKFSFAMRIMEMMTQICTLIIEFSVTVTR